MTAFCLHWSSHQHQVSTVRGKGVLCSVFLTDTYVHGLCLVLKALSGSCPWVWCTSSLRSLDCWCGPPPPHICLSPRQTLGSFLFFVLCTLEGLSATCCPRALQHLPREALKGFSQAQLYRPPPPCSLPQPCIYPLV